MSLSHHTLPLTPAELKAARRVNAVMAVAPRLKISGWRLAVGTRLNALASRASGRVSAAALRRKGITVSALSIETADGPVALRILEPEGLARGIVVDLHGGGWVVGSAALNDRLASYLARAGFVVVSVDYRLLTQGLEDSLADAVADCAHAIRWAKTDGYDRFSTETVLVIGESAGAHLGALAMIKLRDEGEEDLPRCAFVQGVFDLSGTPSVRAATRKTLLFDGPNLKRDLARLAPDRDEDGLRLPDLSPLHADLTGMPEALFVMGQEDPLRDDSLLMAEAWSRHAPTTLLDVPTAPHGFQHFAASTARAAQAFILRWLEGRVNADPVSVDKTNR
ncbi:MAG: alpha/beta hydrolase [Alphaproteobacteria bacterium]|nr:MAG: alpha/beta hydrolase [Alphaproteobacteria bacterium]